MLSLSAPVGLCELLLTYVTHVSCAYAVLLLLMPLLIPVRFCFLHVALCAPVRVL